MRVAANEDAETLNQKLITLFGWAPTEKIHWLSPVKEDDYAEYYDQDFLVRLSICNLNVPLSDFWPSSGARWDGLARTESGKVILVEAKAYIEEGVDYKSKAGEKSFARIQQSLEAAKSDFGANKDAPWESPFYQYANRLAHLYFLHRLNGLDAYLLFLYFADAPDVPKPCTASEWQGSVRLVEKCLGLGKHPYRDRLGTIIWSVPKMPSNNRIQSDAAEPRR
ncbi:hypothetical protein ACFL4G_06765 [Thermodesulfobacteriota bacterium]